VVSADVGTRSYVRLALGDDRFEVREAADGAAAARLLAAQRPAVIVLDLELPGGGGLDLAQGLRTQTGDEDVLVLVLVPRDGTVPDEAPGVDAVLRVPATTFALLRKVDGLLAV